MQVDVILAYHPFENAYILRVTNLDQQVPAAWLDLPDQHVVPVLRRPDDVSRQSRDRMTS